MMGTYLKSVDRLLSKWRFKGAINHNINICGGFGALLLLITAEKNKSLNSL